MVRTAPVLFRSAFWPVGSVLSGCLVGTVLFGCLVGTVLFGCLAGTATAQPLSAPQPLSPPPGANVPRGPNGLGGPRGPGIPSGNPATPPSTSGSSGILRVMIPDATATPTAAAPGTPSAAGSVPTAPPAGSGRPDFRSPGTAGSSKDPTEPLNPEIRRVLEGGTRENNAPPAAPPIPEMRVRARVFVSGQPPVAVLEIGGRQLTIREGSEIHLLGGDSPVGMQLKVTRMTTSEIRLEVVNKNQFITLD
jgi:hypothetical protein